MPGPPNRVRTMLFGGLMWGTVVLAGTAAPEFNPRRVVDPFPFIIEPKSVPAGEAGEFVNDEELVLGITWGGEARAYPINMLTNPTREIINDKLGGRYLAATW